MKYMGSKRAMLLNGLGSLLDRQIAKSNRFVDLFTGSGAVAWFIATRHDIEVLAFDLQQYSVALARGVIARQQPIAWQPLWQSWYESAHAFVSISAPLAPIAERLTRKSVMAIRDWCSDQHDLPVTRSYGGHYFSPRQSLWIDALRATLPSDLPASDVALAALIHASSGCVAAPGHTAQPFQPTRTAIPFLREAWARDICQHTEAALKLLSDLHARGGGYAEVADANVVASQLESGDLVFVDPPYSGVHYSRFYHVLETIAAGACGPVKGTGRYPAPEARPRSEYSIKSESSAALDRLLATIASREANAILTFPNHECSNGLSGKMVRTLAAKYFTIEEFAVKSRFSTLGGNGKKNDDGRAARRNAEELILRLTPTGKSG